MLAILASAFAFIATLEHGGVFTSSSHWFDVTGLLCLATLCIALHLISPIIFWHR